MSYSIKQVANQRWGIYLENKLLATLSCRNTSLKVLKLMQARTRLTAKAC
ncbi:MAG: hypothetical protein AAGE84_21525 [Cyanobacteria bacterium P01_G01_bin.39]